MEKILQHGLEQMGIQAEPADVRRLCAYGARLLEKNAAVNLTAIREPADVARLHFLDCAALLTIADFRGKRVLDVGSGAGFPGVPLRILQPDIRLTCVDSVGKKMNFVKDTCDELGVDGVDCLWGRIEEMPQLREGFPIVVSRAVAELDVLAELCLPQVENEGVFIAMKGPDCGDEVAKSEFAVKTLGGRVREIVRYTIPDTDVTHAAVVIEKMKSSPVQYPRRYAQIKKKPLRG